jgi:RHH-type rel operon transcriptional repressor/antitoxin RelB
MSFGITMFSLQLGAGIRQVVGNEDVCYTCNTMLAVRLPKALEKRLDNLAKRTGRTKSFYVRQALEENFDDLEDARLADQAWDEAARSGARVHTHAEVKKLLRIA